MKFLTYYYNQKENIGLLVDGHRAVLPLKYVFKKECGFVPRSLNEMILNVDEKIIQQLDTIEQNYKELWLSLSDVQIMAPIPLPERDLICMGLNYKEHAEEVEDISGVGQKGPKYPVYFSKRVITAIGHFGAIDSHSKLTKELDYEVELAVVIGKNGTNIKPEEVEDYIFGYTIVNDVSARDLQRNHIQWFKGKSLSTHCAMGPYLVHKSSLSLPLELDIMTKVNGEIRQYSNTNKQIFDISMIISDLSKGMPLLAGDIIITGTPAGVGMGFEPPRYLKSGDVIECSIEKIGSLVNQIR